MKSLNSRVVPLAVMTVALTLSPMLYGCDSPTAPKFPDPTEEQDTVTNEDEGMTRRRLLGARAIPAGESVLWVSIRRCTESEACR